MATPVIQSKGSLDTNTSSSITIIKPTGLAEGDLMLAVLANEHTADRPFNTLSGWTAVGSFDDATVTQTIQWKVADSGDVAASDFTFTTGSSFTDVDGFILRITGHAAATPIGDFDSDSQGGGSATANPSFTCDLNPRRPDALLLMSFAVNDSDGITFSDYTISGTNPTWTEQHDNETTDLILAVATAPANSAADITTFTATLTNSATRISGVILTIPEQASETVTPDSIALSGELPDPTPKSAVKFTTDAISLTTQVNDATGRIKERPWTDEEKGTTTWTNETK